MMRSIIHALILTAFGTQSFGDAEVDHGEAQVDWLRSKFGYFNSRLEFQPLDKADPKSPKGMFAAESISKGEVLVIVPQSCLITSGGSLKMCDTARNLAKEFKLKDKSDFAPYVNYLLDSKRGQLPSAWSEAGKSLLKIIMGKELEPQHITSGLSFEKRCKGSGDPLEQDAYLYMIARSWDDIIIPVLDMMNHRNGHWTNVDSNSAHEGKDITAFATRDIAAGEQLYLSYNRCTDCKGQAHTYVLQNILMDYGFVEQYPQTWRFKIDDCAVVFYLDENVDTGELKLTWVSHKPSTYQEKFFRGHLKRLQNLSEVISEGAKQLVSDHEREVTIDFYQALTTALQHAIWASANEEDEYDELEDRPDDNDDGGDMAKRKEYCGEKCNDLYTTSKRQEKCHGCCRDKPYRKYSKVCDEVHNGLKSTKASYEKIDKDQSYYQTIEVSHDVEKGDHCLLLNKYLHACTSFRSHYHEAIVHYPARFVDEVKRVVFIGGGDSFLIHEILKYPSLELVVGLELDQQVVRSSFKHFGSQPYFHDERVQWWFGDALKSLLALSREYYGTFDLVIVDLATDFVDSEALKVTEDLSIMDTAVLLLSEEGVIARNEDTALPGMTNAFTDYTVYLNFDDVPILCRQSITMGSNSVDLLTRTPKDHNVDTLILGPVNNVEDHFRAWYNYRKTTHATRSCKEVGTEERELVEEESMSRPPSVLMVLEAENTGLPLDSSTLVQAGVSKALKEAGLTEMSVAVSSPKDDDSKRYTMVFILQEGYIVARTWPEHKYCAFDLLLWSSFDKQDAAKSTLLTAVGSNDFKSTTSYRIVMGGMFGISAWREDRANVGPHVDELCEDSMATIRDTPSKQSDIDTVLGEGIALIQDTNTAVAILCGEQLRPCSSLEMFRRENAGAKVIPIWTCPSVVTPNATATKTPVDDTDIGTPQGQVYEIGTPVYKKFKDVGRWFDGYISGYDLEKKRYEVTYSDGDVVYYNDADEVRKMATTNMEKKKRKLKKKGLSGEASHRFLTCESDTLTSLKEFVEVEGKIGSIIIAPAAHREMGQVLHKILSSTSARRDLLTDDYIVLETTSDPSESWRRALLDRFRTDFAKFAPASGAEILFNSTTSSLELGVFSSNDAGFYSHLVDVIASIERKTGLNSEVRKAKRGLLNYIADFEPSKFISEDDFDRSSFLEQWRKQQPLGQQTIFQFETKNPKKQHFPFLTTSHAKETLQGTLLSMKYNADVQGHTIGDGCVVVALWSEGSAILSWDGRSHVDVNFFTYAESNELRESFESLFLKEIPSLAATARDEQPRGFGSVVSFQRDIDRFNKQETSNETKGKELDSTEEKTCLDETCLQ